MISAVRGDIPLPETGQRIRCRLKNGDILTGTVQHVWMSLDTPCINVWFHGTVVQVFPEMGDSWEPATDTGLSTAPDVRRQA